MKPFVKWVGGKRQILTQICELINWFKEDFLPDDFRYIEPFVGGGAVFFSLAREKAIINDLNEDLINAYRVIQSDDYEKLIDALKEHDKNYRADPDGYYYDVRSEDRKPDWGEKDNIHRSARMIFLNRTCYNGLYRVNNKGQFNTPIGRYANPTICDENLIREIHNYLSKNDIKIECGSYEDILVKAKYGDVIYIDPPYDYEDTDGFTKYQMSGFTFEDFKRLKEECDKAIHKGALILITNNATTNVLSLFEDERKYRIWYDKKRINTLRNINCKGDLRRTGKEIIIVCFNFRLTFPQANDVNKIIKLLNAGEETFSDVTKCSSLLDVNSARQVSYYLSALHYFGFINKKKSLTEKGAKIYQNVSLIEKALVEAIENDDIFKNFINLDLNNPATEFEIKKVLKKTYGDLSDETINRRINTVRSYISWYQQHR